MASVLVSLSSVSEKSIYLTAITDDQSAGAGIDYLPVTTNLLFNPGVTSLLVSVPVLPDVDQRCKQLGRA